MRGVLWMLMRARSTPVSDTQRPAIAAWESCLLLLLE